MHVALLCNTAWLDEELTMFRYMVVGLLDENVRVVQVVPDRLPVEEFSSFGARLSWKDTHWEFLRRRRLNRLANELQEQGVDLIHAMDGRLWSAALQLGEQLKCPVVLSANSYLDLPLAEKLLKRYAEQRVSVIASTQPLAQAIEKYIQPQHLLQHIPPGVHPGKDSPPATPSSGTLCAVISGTDYIDSDYEAMLLGLVPIVSAYPQAQFFLDSHGHGNDQRLVWQVARKLGLLSNISLVPRRLGHRELLLGADVLIHPQPAGRTRSLTLQAMASSMPVIAHADPWLDYLLHDKTAWVIERPNPEIWTQAIERLIHQPQDGHQLGRLARQWVAEKHLASDHVGQLITLYQQTLGESYKFPGRS